MKLSFLLLTIISHHLFLCRAFAQTQPIDANWEKFYFDAVKSGAIGVERTYNSCKETIKIITDLCIGVCQQWNKGGDDTVNAENDTQLIRRATSGSQDSSQESRKAKERRKGKRPAEELTDKSLARKVVKRRREYTGIRIGREAKEEDVPPQKLQHKYKQKSSSSRRHSAIPQTTNELRKKMYRLRFSTNQRRERLLRTVGQKNNRQTQSRQNLFRPIRPVRQASSPQTVRSHVAYQSDSSVSSALSNRQHSIHSRQRRPIDHQQTREASNEIASSNSASEISSMSSDS